MTDAHLKAREARLLAELAARRSNSEKQAALITGDDDDEGASEAYSAATGASATARQVAMVLGAGAPRASRTRDGQDAQNGPTSRQQRLREAFGQSSEGES